MDADAVYGPREDTALLRTAALDEVREDDAVLEVGSGSGAVAAAVADEADSVVATEIGRAASRATADRGVPVVRTDLAAGVTGPFSLVLCNPPYLPDDDRTPDDALDVALAGGPTGRELVARFLGTVGRVLADGGRILLLVTSATDVDAVRDVAAEEGYGWRVVAEDRYFFEEFVVARLARE
jgi:release factor glutamine methyltransferase